MNNQVDISGLPKERVLQVLNAAARITSPAAPALPMTCQEAEGFLRSGAVFLSPCFGGFMGRSMYVSVGGDEIDSAAYDRYNGPGAAKAAIDHLRTELAYEAESSTWETRHFGRRLSQ